MFDLDSFLEHFDYRTRMKIVQVLEDAEAPTGGRSMPSETGLGGSYRLVKGVDWTYVASGAA